MVEKVAIWFSMCSVKMSGTIPTASFGPVRIRDEHPDRRLSRKYGYTIIKNSGSIGDFVTGTQMTAHATYRRATLVGYSMSGVGAADTVYFIQFIGFPTNNFSNDRIIVPQNSVPIFLPVGSAVVVDNDANILLFDDGNEHRFPNQFEIKVLGSDGLVPAITELILRIVFEA